MNPEYLLALLFCEAVFRIQILFKKITKAKVLPWYLLKFPLRNISHVIQVLSLPNDALKSSLLLRETVSSSLFLSLRF